jgi:anti-sigma regulatory factor (Ser/Thr protein kinase)
MRGMGSQLVPAMPPWTVRLPADASAPGVAREALDEWLRELDVEVRRGARSVVSELVANAVRQGRAPIELVVEARGGWARIEVADAGPHHGRRPPKDWSQRIIAGLAARWGVRGDDAHVWFELPLGEMSRER